MLDDLLPDEEPIVFEHGQQPGRRDEHRWRKAVRRERKWKAREESDHKT